MYQMVSSGPEFPIFFNTFNAAVYAYHVVIKLSERKKYLDFFSKIQKPFAICKKSLQDSFQVPILFLKEIKPVSIF